MLLFNPQCHTGPPLRYAPVIECKGTYNLGYMQIMKEKLANNRAKKCLGMRKWGVRSKKVVVKGLLLQDN